MSEETKFVSENVSNLKRPDLKGDHVCNACQKSFCHSASLFRHKLRFHIESHECMLCGVIIGADRGVSMRDHMARKHEITSVFSCGCCSWVFPNKKDLYVHNQSMLHHKVPGDTVPIAKARTTEGPLTPLSKQRKSVVVPSKTTPNASKRSLPVSMVENNRAENGTSQPADQESSTSGANSEFSQWINQFVMNNADWLAHYEEMEKATQDENMQATQEENMQTTHVERSSASPNAEDVDVFSGVPLLEKSDHSEGESVSPVPSVSSVNSQADKRNTKKRRAVDDIASTLLLKKLCGIP